MTQRDRTLAPHRPFVSIGHDSHGNHATAVPSGGHRYADLWSTFEVVTAPLDEVPFTELIQQPTRTTNRLAHIRALRLRRRDADDLVLMSAERARREGEVVDLTARLLASLLRQDGGPELVRQALPMALPWTRFLPAVALDEFVTEFADVAAAAHVVTNTAPLTQLLIEWRHTAEVYADPDLHAVLARGVTGDFGSVVPPEDAA